MYITSCKGGDGFGSQYQRIVMSILYSEITNNEFVYRPFEKMEHNYDNDPDFIIKKEKFINLYDKYKLINEVENVLELGPRVYEIENNLDFCLKLESLKNVKKFLHIGKTNPYDNNYLNVAVHIRKFNQGDNTDYSHDENYYLNVMNHIRNNYTSEKLKFHIFSQGELENFTNFKSDDIVFHLNESIEDTFYGLVTANILVMSKSSFSYTAAMLSDGIIYYLPFWHPKASHWITI